MKNYLKQKLVQLQQLAKKHIEYIGILIALLIVYICPMVIRAFDPSAAPLDPGILSAIVLAVVAVLVFLSVTWWIIRSIWSFFCTYSENQLVTDFNTLTPWQKVRIYLGFYLALALLFVAALIAMLK